MQKAMQIVYDSPGGMYMHDEESLLTQKKKLRMEMNAALRGIEPARAIGWSREACRQVLLLREYREAEIVLAFLSMPREISTGHFIAEAFAAGKTVAVPRMEQSPEQGEYLAFIILPGDWERWPRDRFGIPLPPDNALPLQEARMRTSKAFVLAPGLAFDRSGNRLGRGKGYYDKFLTSLMSGANNRPFTCGFCFSQQLVERVPCGPADIPVDLVVSEKGIAGR
jgi:5-formyltetrahydrofolate cyclo-ligase